MQLLDQTLVLSPSDLTNALACKHLSALSYEVAHGRLDAFAERAKVANLPAKHGDEHEQRYLRRLRDAGMSVIGISVSGRGTAALRAGETETIEAMRSGVDAIYQGTFFDGRWRGHADFLERVDVPGALGEFSYEVVDAKLARHVKVSALLQTLNYSEHLTRLQGVVPKRVHIELGDGRRESFLVSDFDAYYRTIKRHFEASLDAGVEVGLTYPDKVAHCEICDWADNCASRREVDDHLSLVANLSRTQVEKFERAGIDTVAKLGVSDIERVAGIGQRTFVKLRRQASMQAEQRRSGIAGYELLEPVADQGLGALPEPSPGDLFFDMEGDPYIGTHGIEYLFGVTQVVDNEPVFRSFWGHDEAGEKKAFEDFIDLVMGALTADPSLHIYHYASYEKTAMKKLAARHGTREWEVDRLLTGETFVDLYRVVRQGVRISQSSYSIKKLEAFYMGDRETNVVGGAESIVQYETWLDTGEQWILDDIEKYNEDDCRSTWLLRKWLEERHVEASKQLGDIARPEPKSPDASEELTELENRIREMEVGLVAVGPGSENYETLALLGHLLEWHRRERKSEWWRFHDLCDMSIDELCEDREAIGGLEYAGVVDTVKQSLVHRYRFEQQEHKIGVGMRVFDPATELSVGVVVDVVSDEGVIDLKRGAASLVGDVHAVMPPGPLRYEAQQQAMLDIGQWVVDNGLEHPTRFRCGLDLLQRKPPRLSPAGGLAQIAGDATKAACELAIRLDRSCLAIQGPPGSGKTYAGAEIVLALVARGLRVGITATGHKVIGNLLDEVIDHSKAKKVEVRVMQKADPDKRCNSPEVTVVTGSTANDAVRSAVVGDTVDVVGGTAWLFAREELREQFDVLIVDEAGQMSLADVLAVSTSAKSLILLGDPRQLAQPSKGVHPDGAEASALAHLLGEHQTIPDDLGLLLDKSWRMHPEVCEFVSDAFYESRLSSIASCSQQHVAGDDFWGGVGLRYVSVEHRGNRTSSMEEADAIIAGFDALLGREWINRDGVTRAIGLDDVLVVAPYNAQVSLLQRRLPDGARIGTVDKFQGQEAAVVFYSLAVSTPEDISRGMEFLYSVNRLNVAVSRARCLTFLVCNPELLTIVCNKPEQARLANALCRYVESTTAG